MQPANDSSEALQLGLGQLLQGARPTTSLQAIITSVLERIHAEFGILLNTAAACNDDDRKRLALSYLHSSRQQLLRLVALVQWHPKNKAQLQCVEPGQVLDTARRHAQLLEAAAVELYEAHMRAQPDFSPMFDVQTALDVLSTGCYTDLPSSIEKLGSCAKPSPEQQARKLRHITHLLHSHLLQTQLPDGVVVKEVGKGYAILCAPDLYEVKLTLVPASQLPPEDPPQAAPGSNTQDATAAAGEGGGDGGGVQGVPGSSKVDMMDIDDEVSSGKPPTRWRWYLLGLTILAKAVQGPALQDQQVRKLLRDLNNRMHVAADAAVYEARRQQAGGTTAAAAAGGGEGGEGGMQVTGSQMMSGGATASKQPGGSALTTTSKQLATTKPHLSHNLQLLARYAADEATAPIMIMHSVLSDVSGRLLLDAAKTVAQQLTTPGGCWHGHTSIQPGTSSSLDLGFTITFWTKAAPLLPLTSSVIPPGTAAAGATAQQGQQGRAAGKPDAGVNSQFIKPFIEIGIAPEGHVHVMTNVTCAAAGVTGGTAVGGGASQQDVIVVGVPGAGGGSGQAAGAPGQQQAADAGSVALTPEETALSDWGGFTSPLSLNAVTVNVDELLLRAASQLVWGEMLALKEQLTRDMQTMAVPGTCWQLKLSGFSTHVLPVTAQPLVHTLTVQQAISSTGAAAGRAARQARATHQSHATTASTHGATHGDPGSTLGGGSSSSVVARDNAASGLQVEIRFPVLEFWSCGELLVKLSRSLFTGRLLAQPGPGLAGDANLQSLSNWSQREEDINSLLMRLYIQPVSQGASAGSTAKDAAPVNRILPELSLKLSGLLKEQQRALAISSCMSAARQLHLHLGGPSSRLINAFHAEHPWVDIKRFYTLWSLPPSSFPASFPPLYNVPPGSHPSFVPHSLSAVLGADHPSNPRAMYSLFLVACSAQMLPLKVLKVIPVPQQVYTCTGHALELHDQPQVPHSTLQARPLSSDIQGGRSVEADQVSCVDSPQGGRQPLPSSSSTGHTAGHGMRGGRPQAHSPQLRLGAVGGMSTGGSGGGPPSVPARDLHRELSAVVGWCQRRFCWEKLVVQLKALTIGFIETNLTDPHHPGTCIQLHSLAGTSIPCRIARRKGLHPARIGLRRVTLSVTCEGEQQTVHVMAHGSWFSSRPWSPDPGSQQGGYDSNPQGNARSGGGGEVGVDGLRARAISQPAPGQVRLTYSFTHGQSALDVLADLVCIIRMQTFLARMECTAVGSQQLCVRSLKGRHQDGSYTTGGVVGLGKRVKMEQDGVDLQRPAKLQCTGEPGAPVGNGNHLMRAGSNSHVMIGGDGGGDAALYSHQLSPADSNVQWQWPPNGVVRLVAYDLTSAVLEWQGDQDAGSGAAGPGDMPQYAAAQNGGGGGGGGGGWQGMPVKQEVQGVQGTGHVVASAGTKRLQYKIRWVAGSLPAPNLQLVSHASGTAATAMSSFSKGTPTAGGTPLSAAAAPSPLPPGVMPPTTHQDMAGDSAARDSGVHELVQCQVSLLHPPGCATQEIGPGTAAAQGSGNSCGMSSGLPAGPLDVFLQGLGEMGAAGEEGLLLDAVFIAAQPMHALQVSLDAHCPQPGRPLPPAAGGLPAGKQLLHVTHVPDCGPLSHELVLSLPMKPGVVKSDREGDAGTAAAELSASGACIVLRFICMAVGRVWLCVTVPEVLSGERSAGQLLAVLLHQLQQQLGKQAVYVATAWSQIASGAALTPRQSGTTWVWSSRGQGRKQMWLLIQNSHLEQAVRVLLQTCERVLLD